MGRCLLRRISMALEVQVIESCFVAPSEATPRKGLWLSPLDLDLVNRGHTPTVYFYRSHDTGANFFDTAKLKEAMAKALVSFYPLAGRLDVDGDGRVEISCNDEGALFVIARCDLSVDDFSNFKPSPELRRLFVPHVEPSSVIMAIQVTFMKCGGVALGTALHHVAIDAMSAFHFFQTWSAFSRDGNGATVDLPCHDRTLLHARSPPVVHPDALSVFCPKITFSETSTRPTATRVFTISRDQVAFLKRLCGGASTFSTMSALVWQCTCVARQLPPNAEARISFPVNVRRRMRPPLPNRYFGNALVCLYAAGAVRDIASEPIESVAGRIRGVIRRMDDELVRSAIDYYELKEVDSRPLRGIMPETELRMVSWLGMPLYDSDFGWGKPWVMSRAESVRGGFVYLMNDGPVDSGAVRILMCMEAANMEEFERLLYAKVEKHQY